MGELKDLRISQHLTQQEVANTIGISLRSYVSYENYLAKEHTPKYRFLLHEVSQMKLIDEEHGILTVKQIRTICSEVFQKYPVEFCYLFGSYAKGKEKETSDVDLLISTDLTGLKFYELAEVLRETLKKKVDLLNIEQLVNNEVLIRDVLRDGIRIYG